MTKQEFLNNIKNYVSSVNHNNVHARWAQQDTITSRARVLLSDRIAVAEKYGDDTSYERWALKQL